jgi:tRNA-splicing ligase RtcB (3'-phosphate/5'-hydroxy nucleic acid ligase)
MKVMTTEKLPIKMWLDEIEEGALEQAENLANLPFLYKHVAIMPDCHQGYGMPIGGVIATSGVVIPNAVGVDIGCGMIAAKTSIVNVDVEQIKATMGKIREAVPVGFAHHDKAQEWEGFDDAPDINVVQRELASARKQIGTLGGGNHFIEIQQDEDALIWIMVHSGSRNFGYKIAKEYHAKAKALCERWFSDIPDPELSFLPIETREAKEYLEAMNYALAFAYQNRKLMLGKALECFESVVGSGGFVYDDYINIHHNYAAWENHFGKNVIVHRKGATLAREDTIGIIPGSQGTKSYIVQGKGNPQSFMSCSHGAGRRMGRKQATRELDLANEIKRLDDQGIVHGIRNTSDLDEAAGAYKDIDTVMKNQEDLVKIIHELSPLGVVKG